MPWYKDTPDGPVELTEGCVTRHGAEGNEARSWCGREIRAWAFLDVDHAAENDRRVSGLVVCGKCAAAICMALAAGHDGVVT